MEQWWSLRNPVWAAGLTPSFCINMCNWCSHVILSPASERWPLLQCCLWYFMMLYLVLFKNFFCLWVIACALIDNNWFFFLLVKLSNREIQQWFSSLTGKQHYTVLQCNLILPIYCPHSNFYRSSKSSTQNPAAVRVH